MNDVASTFDTTTFDTTTTPPSSGRSRRSRLGGPTPGYGARHPGTFTGRPRLWLVREETGPGYQAGERAARPGEPDGLPGAPGGGPGGLVVDELESDELESDELDSNDTESDATESDATKSDATKSDATESHATKSEQPETVSDWSRVHARVVELGAERGRHERELCRWLLAAERLGVHVRAGYASLREYAERVVGLTGRQTEERLRVGRALGELPELDRALAGGQLCFSVVRELTRVAQPETEQEWLAWAGGKTTRQVERAVATRRPGDGPRDPADPSRLTHRLAFEVRADTMALFRDLQATVRRDLGGEVDDDTLLYEVARRALGGPTEAGRASYQVAVTRCADCGRAAIDAGGQRHPVDPVVVAMADCDSQQLGAVGGAAGGGQRSGGQHSGGQHSGGHDDHRSSPHAGAAEGASAAAPEPPPPAPSSPHAGAKTMARAPRRRARQTIAPAVRRAVLRRDGYRCAVPGCTNHRFLDVHHLDPLAEGGSHDPDRVITLCGAHHRHTHFGSLCIAGNAKGGFTFCHADGTSYGQALRPAAVDLAQQTYSTLRHLGFPHGRARALVDAVAQAGAPATLEDFVSAALRGS